MSIITYSWQGGKNELPVIQSMIDLLEEAREAIKVDPKTTISICTNISERTITFTIHADEQVFQSVIVPELNHLNKLPSITIS